MVDVIDKTVLNNLMTNSQFGTSLSGDEFKKVTQDKNIKITSDGYKDYTDTEGVDTLLKAFGVSDDTAGKLASKLTNNKDAKTSLEGLQGKLTGGKKEASLAEVSDNISKMIGDLSPKRTVVADKLKESNKKTDKSSGDDLKSVLSDLTQAFSPNLNSLLASSMFGGSPFGGGFLGGNPFGGGLASAFGGGNSLFGDGSDYGSSDGDLFGLSGGNNLMNTLGMMSMLGNGGSSFGGGGFSPFSSGYGNNGWGNNMPTSSGTSHKTGLSDRLRAVADKLDKEKPTNVASNFPSFGGLSGLSSGLGSGGNTFNFNFNV